MPKSSKEISAVARVTRSLRNRVVSVDNDVSGRSTPTERKDLESISENDNIAEESKISSQTATPRGRPRRSSQSEAISTPVKTPARRLTRRTSLSEVDNATVSSPLRRSTRKISTLVENIVADVLEEADEEEIIILEKRANRSSSKSPGAVSSKIKNVPGNSGTKKRGSKGKKSRTPSPLNNSDTIQENNANQKDEIQSRGNSDNNHNSTVLPPVREDSKEEQETPTSASKSPSSGKLETSDTKKRGSKGKKSRTPSPLNNSDTIQENNANQKVELQSSGNSDKNHNSAVLPAVREDSKEEQETPTSASKSPSSGKFSFKNSDPSITVETAFNTNTMILPMKSPVEKEQEAKSSPFRRVTRSASKSPVVPMEKLETREQATKKNITKLSTDEAMGGKTSIEEDKKVIEVPESPKKVQKDNTPAIAIKDIETKTNAHEQQVVDETEKKNIEVPDIPTKTGKDLSDIGFKEAEITKLNSNEQLVEKVGEITEVIKSPNRAKKNTMSTEIKETSVMINITDDIAEDIMPEKSTSDLFKFTTALDSEGIEKVQIPTLTDSGLGKTTTEEVLDIGQKKVEVFASVDHNDSGIVNSDVSKAKTSGVHMDNQNEEERENRQPEKEHNADKNQELSILDTSLGKSAKHLEIEREETRIEHIETNEDISILDNSLSASAKDTANIKQTDCEPEKCEDLTIEHTNVNKDNSVKNQEISNLDGSLSTTVENNSNEENISTQSMKSAQNGNETLDASILNSNNISIEQMEEATEKPIEDQTEVIKKQKSVTFNSSSESDKMPANYPKTPISSKSKSYVEDEDESKSLQISSKRAISLDDANRSEGDDIAEVSEQAMCDVTKPDASLKKMKAPTVLSSTPIIDSKKQKVLGTPEKSESSNEKTNTCLPFEDCSKDYEHGFSKSWSQAVIGKSKNKENGAAFIDGLERERKRERDAALISQIKSRKKDDISIRKEEESSEDDEEDEDQNSSDFLDDEAMEVSDGHESMDSEERRYLEENEIPEQGESIGSEDTDQEEEGECDEEQSLHSFIASDTDENNDMLSCSAEFSSDESSDEEETKGSNKVRQLQSSDEDTDQDTDKTPKTKRAYKLFIESSDEEPEVSNDEHKIGRGEQNKISKEGNNLDVGEQKAAVQTTELDGSTTQQENEEFSNLSSKNKSKPVTPEEVEEKSNSIISIESSCLDMSIRLVTQNQEDNSSSATDNCQNKISVEDETNTEEYANTEKEFNDRADNKQDIPNISAKEKERRSSLKVTTSATELESIKEKGVVALRNLNSSEETLSATEKSIHSKTLHETNGDRANTTIENPTLEKERIEVDALSEKELPAEQSVGSEKEHDKIATSAGDEKVKGPDEDLTSHKRKHEEILFKRSFEPFNISHKGSKDKECLKKRVFSSSFNTFETDSTEVDQTSLSFTFIPKKSKKVEEDNEQSQSSEEKVQVEEVSSDSPNLDEQSLLNETFTSKLHLDKIYTESDTSQNGEFTKEKDKSKTSPKMSKAQKVSRNSNPDNKEVREKSFEERSMESSEVSCAIPIPDSSSNFANQPINESQQPCADAEETMDLTPIVQILTRSEAYLESLIDIKESTDRKIKRMSKKLQKLCGDISPRSTELLDENERPVAVALVHALHLLQKLKRKVARKLAKIEGKQNETELINEDVIQEEVQEHQHETTLNVCKENVDSIPAQSSKDPNTLRSQKRKKVSPPTSAEIHEQRHAAYRKSLDYIKTSSGIFVQEPASPQMKKAKKFKITSTLELPTGLVYEQPITPKSKKVVNGFQETQATPKAVGFKVKSILSAGQKEVPSLNKRGTKRKLDLAEPTLVLPKPKWVKSGNFTAKKSQNERSFIPVNVGESSESTTAFMVTPLNPKKSKAKREDFNTLSQGALDFKRRALSNKQIIRESSHNILQRKQKIRANREF